MAISYFAHLSVCVHMQYSKRMGNQKNKKIKENLERIKSGGEKSHLYLSL